MRFKSFSIIIIALLASGIAKSQINGSNANQIEFQLQNYYQDFVNKQIGIESVISYENIKGDPYLYKDFEKGTILIDKDKNIVGKLRYNMYSDEIEFIYHDNRLILVYEDAFTSIKIGDYEFVQLPDPEKTDNKPGYFISLKKGKYNLLLKKSVRFLEEEKPKIYAESKPGRFEKNTDKYFIMSDDNTLYEFGTIHKLKRYSDDLKAQIEEYTTDKKLKVNDEDLIDFFTWLDSK